LKDAAILWHLLGQKVLTSAQDFMNAVGLDRPAGDLSHDDACGENRANILFCVQLLMATVKRCTWPDDPDKAARGGFVVSFFGLGDREWENCGIPNADFGAI